MLQDGSLKPAVESHKHILIIKRNYSGWEESNGKMGKKHSQTQEEDCFLKLHKMNITPDFWVPLIRRPTLVQYWDQKETALAARINDCQQELHRESMDGLVGFSWAPHWLLGPLIVESFWAVWV